MSQIEIDPGSFRDPAGQIFSYNNKILRILENEGKSRFDFLKKNNLLENCITKDFLIQSNELTDNNLILDKFKNKTILEHKKLDYISYPYEWSFEQLKNAAIHHLDFHISYLKV